MSTEIVKTTWFCLQGLNKIKEVSICIRTQNLMSDLTATLKN